MPPCDARRAQGRPTCGRTGGGGVSAVSSVAFGAVRSRYGSMNACQRASTYIRQLPCAPRLLISASRGAHPISSARVQARAVLKKGQRRQSVAPFREYAWKNFRATVCFCFACTLPLATTIVSDTCCTDGTSRGASQSGQPAGTVSMHGRPAQTGVEMFIRERRRTGHSLGKLPSPGRDARCDRATWPVDRGRLVRLPPSSSP